MIIVLGKSVFKAPITPEVRDRLGELARAVRERHSGNLDYRFSIDAGDPHVLRLTERWDRLESFVAHGRTPEVAAIVELVNPRDTETVEVKRYEVASEAVV